MMVKRSKHFFDVSKSLAVFGIKTYYKNLKHKGIKEALLQWLASYLSNRKQRVVIPGACSEWVAITAGVPQGSILGPLLFLIYINDIIKDIHSHIRLFADDTSLYLIIDEPCVAAMQLYSDLAKLHMWAERWPVKFNPA